MYTTCMQALRMHFLPATGLYGLARGSAAAAQRFAGSHAPLRGVFYAGFCAFKAVALRCAGAGANAAAPLRARKAMTARIVLESALARLSPDKDSGGHLETTRLV